MDRGSGLEAWRRLNRRFDPSTGNRKKALLKHILKPQRVEMNKLSGALESWIDSVRLYERRKDSSRNRLKLADDVKISALEDMVPTELETHMQLNSDRFTTYADMIAEITTYIEKRTGNKVLHSRTEWKRPWKDWKDPDAMDVGGIGKGRGRGWHRKGSWK